MRRADVLQVMDGLAREQWGLVTAGQVRAQGLEDRWLTTFVRGGVLTRVRLGVYRFTDRPPTPFEDIKAAWLHLDPSAPASQRTAMDHFSGAVSHTTACRLWGLGLQALPNPPLIELTVQHHHHIGGLNLRLHTSTAGHPLAHEDTAVLDGHLPVTTARRTLVDLMRTETDPVVVGTVLAEAADRDLVDLDDMAEHLRHYAPQYGLPTAAFGEPLIAYLLGKTTDRGRAAMDHRIGRVFGR
ncbi:hypothetical protein OHV05_37050 (plasmid) [Kitasatospora sp. NBC_00070]|uniref:type IV toxin-antitoxin system AbiEi family antitoxin domain-containing protein n=1 Tax=Kitasatospora sp. NBC_00070 TaxID=2975962 RepID=UPI002F91616F